MCVVFFRIMSGLIVFLITQNNRHVEVSKTVITSKIWLRVPTQYTRIFRTYTFYTNFVRISGILAYNEYNEINSSSVSSFFYLINIDTVSVSVLYTWMKIYYIKLFNLLCSIYVNLMLANIVTFLIWFGTVLHLGPNNSITLKTII